MDYNIRETILKLRTRKMEEIEDRFAALIVVYAIMV